MAAPITVTATLNDASGTALQGNAFLRFRLRNFQGYVPQVAGTALVVEPKIDALPNGSGQISQTLWANNAITPSSTFYTVELWNQGGIISSGNYIFNANTDLDSASQINAPPVPASFQLVLMHNGALNSSQTTLNLVNTDGSITITDLGSGSIQLNGAPTVSFKTSGQGWFAGPGMTDASSIFMNSATAPITNYAANVVVAVQFVLQATWKISSCSFELTSVGSPGDSFAFGIYNAAGQLLQNCTFNANASGIQTISFTPLTLPPGIYYFAYSAADASAHGPGTQPGSCPIQVLAALNAVNPLIATAANPMSGGGVLPSTLGVLTAASAGTWQSIPLAIWAV
jgi:hypothetical protein